MIDALAEPEFFIYDGDDYVAGPYDSVAELLARMPSADDYLDLWIQNERAEFVESPGEPSPLT